MLISIKKVELNGDIISKGIICLKALRIYDDLPKETPSTNAEVESWFTSKASIGWF